MKNRLMDYSDLRRLQKEHIDKIANIWASVRERLYRKYVSEGFWDGFALVKANNEVIRLRSEVENPCSMHIPAEFTKQGDLD